MGNHGDNSGNFNYSSDQTSEFEQLDHNHKKGFIQKIVEAIDETLIRDSVPSPKLVNFFCALADGKFISNEKFREIEQLKDDLKNIQVNKKLLEKEIQVLKASNNNLEIKLVDIGVQKDKFERQYTEINKKLDEKKKKLNNSPIQGIVTFE